MKQSNKVKRITKILGFWVLNDFHKAVHLTSFLLSIPRYQTNFINFKICRQLQLWRCRRTSLGNLERFFAVYCIFLNGSSIQCTAVQSSSAHLCYLPTQYCCPSLPALPGASLLLPCLLRMDQQKYIHLSPDSLNFTNFIPTLFQVKKSFCQKIL